jgi:hypothetical protein
MKKLKLNLIQLENVEVLTRGQLKNVRGGTNIGCPSSCIPEVGGPGIGCKIGQTCVTLTCTGYPNSSTYTTCQA